MSRVCDTEAKGTTGAKDDPPTYSRAFDLNGDFPFLQAFTILYGIHTGLRICNPERMRGICEDSYIGFGYSSNSRHGGIRGRASHENKHGRSGEDAVTLRGLIPCYRTGIGKTCVGKLSRELYKRHENPVGVTRSGEVVTGIEALGLTKSKIYRRYVIRRFIQPCSKLLQRSLERKQW